MQKYEKYLEDEDIKDWFQRGRFRERTKKNYYLSFQLYCEFTKMTAAELRAEAEDEEDRNIRLARRSVVKKIEDYREWLSDPEKCKRKFAPRSIEDHMSTVMSFYKRLMIVLPEKLPCSSANLPKPLPQNTIDLEIDDIRDMLRCADVLERALILVGCASGLAMSDIINLQVGDFMRGYDPETQITTLQKWDSITQTFSPLIRVKTQVEFFTYLTPEASQAVLDYLSWRNRKPKKGNNPARRRQLQQHHVTREEGYLFILKNIPKEYFDIRKGESVAEWEKRYAEIVASETDEEWQAREDLRKYHEDTFVRMYQRLAEKSDKCNTRGYNPGRSHNMRKFFSNTLKHNTIPGVDNFFIEFLMGHTIPPAQQPYFKGKALLYREKYKNCIPFLTIEKSANVTESPEYKKLQENNKILLLETQRHVVERQELQDLRQKLADAEVRVQDKIKEEVNEAMRIQLPLIKKDLKDMTFDEIILDLEREAERDSEVAEDLRASKIDIKRIAGDVRVKREKRGDKDEKVEDVEARKRKYQEMMDLEGGYQR